MQQRIQQLDAVRGLAILLVIFHNTCNIQAFYLNRLAAHGWMGVDLFFVLSGFLITGILLNARNSKGYYRNFYARRCLRIWPLYYSVLFLMFVVIPFLRPSITSLILKHSHPRWSYLFFLQNFLTDVPTLAAGPLGVTWSLGVEELFYLAWAPVVSFLSLGQVRRLAVSILVLSPPLRLYLTWDHVLIYSNPFCRLDGLMAGALLAVLLRSGGFRPDRYLGPAWSVLLACGALAVVTNTYGAPWLSFSMTSLASLSFVFVSLFSPKLWFQRLLRNKFLSYTGVVSYGLYLLHKIPIDLIKASGMNLSPLLSFILTLLGSYMLAFASWHVLERPFLKLKQFCELRPNRPIPGIGTSN